MDWKSRDGHHGAESAKGQPLIERPRLVLVAEDGLFRDGLRSILSSARGAEVVLATGDRTSVLRVVETSRPHVVLVDLAAIPGADEGILADLLRTTEGASLLILTESNGAEDRSWALPRSGVGVLSKRKPAEALLEAVDGLRATTPDTERSGLEAALARVLRRFRGNVPKPFTRLTRRENEVADLVSHGLNNRELADRLRISEATVRHHLTSIFAKLEVRDRVGLVIASLSRPRPPEPER